MATPKMVMPKDSPKKGKTPSPFLPLTQTEKETSWGSEYQIGVYFAKDGDYYRAITSFKRSLVLLSKGDLGRQDQVEYAILLSYYLAQKYDRAIHSFETSHLVCVGRSFPAYHDLLLILFESYKEVGDNEKADHVLELIQKESPKTAEDLKLAYALRQGNRQEVSRLTQQNPDKAYIQRFSENYQRKKKSPKLAMLYNGLLPGSGYWYVGQKKAAFTSLLLNGLFIWASYEFFARDFYAAGAAFTAVEIGWYVGGIYGGKEAALEYNERLYRQYANKVMHQEHLFPIFKLNYVF